MRFLLLLRRSSPRLSQQLPLPSLPQPNRPQSVRRRHNSTGKIFVKRGRFATAKRPLLLLANVCCRNEKDTFCRLPPVPSCAHFVAFNRRVCLCAGSTFSQLGRSSPCESDRLASAFS